MANIGILLDFYQGHVFPALGMAKMIEKLGHQPHLLGIPDVEDQVESYGFHFHPVFEPIFPKGFLNVHRQMQKFRTEVNTKKQSALRPHIGYIIDGGMSSIIAKLNLELIIVTHSLCLEALVLYYKYPDLKFIIFNTWLRDPDLSPRIQCEKVLKMQSNDIKSDIFLLCDSTNIEKITAPLDKILEIIACPKEFEIPRMKYKTKIHHLNSCIRESLTQTNFIESLNISDNKKILYASLGSQAILFPKKAEKFCRLIFEFMKLDASSDFLLILSVGQDIYAEFFEQAPVNIKLVEWAPQLEVLEHSSLVISHGGLGTIKESISKGVPLLIIPMVNDEFKNGERVEYHGLGISSDLDTLTPIGLANDVRKILDSEIISENLNKMKKVFNIDDTFKFNEILNNNLGATLV